MSESKVIVLHYNAFQTIEEQLMKQHFKLENIDLYEKARINILYLYIHGFATDKEKDKMINRLHKEIIKKIKKENTNE